MRIRPLDIAAAVAAAVAIAIAAVAVYAPDTAAPEVVITGADGEWIYPIDTDRKLAVAGPLGITTVVISGKTVRVVDSPCKNKVCIAMGAISAPGQWVACLPNKVFVRVEGTRAERGVDANAY